jgi:hypothetical protein
MKKCSICGERKSTGTRLVKVIAPSGSDGIKSVEFCDECFNLYQQNKIIVSDIPTE